MRAVLFFLGTILKSFSFFFILPILYASFMHEPVLPFVIPAVISFMAGIILRKGVRFMNLISSKPISLDNLSLTEGFILTSSAFIAVSIISLIPYLSVMEGGVFRVGIDALFESVSGITTTGLSVIDSVDGLPGSILLWRSETQWVGGVGILIVFFFIIYKMRHSKESNSQESPSAATALYTTMMQEKIEPGLRKTAQNIVLLYSGYTLLGIFLLYLSGISLFESLNLSFASISTGGFAVNDTFSYDGLQLAVISFLMIMGSISYLLHDRFLRQRFREFFTDPEIVIFGGVLAVFITISLLAFSEVRVVIFMTISAITTTGFSIAAIPALPQVLIFLLAIAMLIGGTMGSTSGGIKLFRVYTVFRSIPWIIKKFSYPSRAVIPFRVSGKPMDTHVLLVTQIFVTCYFMIVIIGTLLFMLLGFSFLDSSFQVISGLSTCGLSTMSISSLPVVGKLFMIVVMLFGRLEIFPLLVFLRKLFT